MRPRLLAALAALALSLGYASSQGLAGCRADYLDILFVRCFAEHTVARLGPVSLYAGLEARPLALQWGPYLGLVWSADPWWIAVEGRQLRDGEGRVFPGLTILLYRTW